MKKLIYILPLLILIACEETITINGTESARQIVINSIISTDSTWNVNLSYSQSIFDDKEIEFIEYASAKVTNLMTGQTFFLKNTGNGDFRRALQPSEGHAYELEINTLDGKTATAQTYVPSVLKVDVVKNDLLDSEGNQSIEIDIEIEDNPNEENFYVWELVENKRESITTEPGESTNNKVQALDGPESNSTVDLKSLNSPLFISDNNFNGKTYSAKITVGDDVLNSVVGEPSSDGPEYPRFKLRIMAVSKDLFEYLRTYEIYKQTEIKITSIAQPVEVYSNIENGLGIFGGYNLKEFPIQLI